MQGLMASVASVTEAPRSDADIIMTRQGNSLLFTFGAKATKVDTIQFSILSDPTRLHAITTNNSLIHINANKEI